MAGFSERLSAMKGKQEASEQMKKEQAEKAAEAARLEHETKRSELSAERDTVMAEFTQAEQTANEAREAIAQADAFAEQQGENLDPEAKAEIDAMKVEAGEVQQKFEGLKIRLDGLNTEISAFEGSEESQETSAEATGEVVQEEIVEQTSEQTTSEVVEPMIDQETPVETAEQNQEDKSQEIEGLLKESQEFSDNHKKYGETGREAVAGFLKEKYPDLEPETEQYSEAWGRLVQGITYNQFKGSEYFVKHPEITFDQYQGDGDRLDAQSDFATRVESAKTKPVNQSSFSVQVKGEKGWEFVTVDMDNLDSLDDATKERFLTGLQNEKKRGVGPSKLSILVEKGLLNPDEVGDYLKTDRDVVDLFSPSAIKKLQENPAWAKRIQQEVEVAAGNLESFGKNEPDLAAAYSAKILRAGSDSLDVRRTLLQHHIKPEDLKMALTKQIEQASKSDHPVAGNRFTPRDLGAFAEAGIISHEKLMEIAKRDVEWYRNNGVEANADKRIAEHLRNFNTAHNLGEAVQQAYVYKKLGLISQAELDQLLAY
ncbi:MAG: hypothetical protein WC885_04515 [Candidatus Shapirobacteria bacterium]